MQLRSGNVIEKKKDSTRQGLPASRPHDQTSLTTTRTAAETLPDRTATLVARLKSSGLITSAHWPPPFGGCQQPSYFPQKAMPLPLGLVLSYPATVAFQYLAWLEPGDNRKLVGEHQWHLLLADCLALVTESQDARDQPGLMDLALRSANAIVEEANLAFERPYWQSFTAPAQSQPRPSSANPRAQEPPVCLPIQPATRPQSQPMGFPAQEHATPLWLQPQPQHPTQQQLQLQQQYQRQQQLQRQWQLQRQTQVLPPHRQQPLHPPLPVDQPRQTQPLHPRTVLRINTQELLLDLARELFDKDLKFFGPSNTSAPFKPLPDTHFSYTGLDGKKRIHHFPPIPQAVLAERADDGQACTAHPRLMLRHLTAILKDTHWTQSSPAEYEGLSPHGLELPDDFPALPDQIGYTVRLILDILLGMRKKLEIGGHQVHAYDAHCLTHLRACMAATPLLHELSEPQRLALAGCIGAVQQSLFQYGEEVYNSLFSGEKPPQ